MKKVISILLTLALMLTVSSTVFADTENVLMDPSFEDGIYDNWVSYNGCLIEETGDTHEGSVAAFVSERTSHVDVPMQDITDRLIYKGPGQYTVSAWVKLDEAFDEMPIQIVVQLQAGAQSWPTTEFVTVKGGVWTKLEGTLDLNWTEGALTYAEFYFNTTPTDGNMGDVPGNEFTIDECSLIKTGAAQAFPAATPKPTATPAPTATPVPTATIAPTASPVVTATAVAATATATAASDTDTKGGMSAGTWIIILAGAALLLGGGAAFFIIKKKGTAPKE